MQKQPEIDEALRRAVELKEVPGVVAVAATGKEIIYQGAFGKRDLAKDGEMSADSVFWIASMTKAVTSAAAMQLVEQGKLSLDEPIGRLLPQLAAPRCSRASTIRVRRACATRSARSRSSCS